MMEEEIDLRAYVEVLLRYWKWIVGLAVIAAVVAFVFSSLLAPTYEASAVVLVTEPRFQLQFDPRFQTDEGAPAYNAFPILATSDSILQSVVETYEPSPEAKLDPWNLTTLNKVVEASSEGDPSLVVLKVVSGSPKDATGIANTWATVLVEQGNEIYGGSKKDVAFFERQVKEAEQELDDAEAALIAFEAQNQGSIVQAQLNSLNRTQDDYLASQRTIAYIVQDIQSLRTQLAEQPGSQSASLADNLTALFLQIKAFNASASAPIQLQVDSSESLSSKSITEQIVFLDELVTTLQAKSAEIDTRLAELVPEILALQQQQQEIQVKEDRLTRERDLDRETYLTLVRKLDEARISAQEENGMLQVGSYAAVPVKPVGPRRLFNTAIAGMLGLMVGVVGAFAVEFWRQNGKQATQD